MINSKTILISIILLTFTLSGCVSLVSPQTGRTLGKDNASFNTSCLFGIDIDEQYYSCTSDSYIKDLSFGGSYGITDNFDVSVKYNAYHHISFAGKYQFLGNKHSFFATSIRTEIGISYLSAFFGYLGYGGGISMHNSVFFGEYLSLTISPSYYYFGINNYLHTGTNNYLIRNLANCKKSNNVYGYTINVLVGKEHQLSLGLSQLVNNKIFDYNSKFLFSMGYVYNLSFNKM